MSWKQLLTTTNLDVLFENCLEKINILRENNISIYPPNNQILRAFKECPMDTCKVVIIGQDPYHNVYNGKPSACGVAFATENGYVSPSLKIMFEELHREYDKDYRPEDLFRWCKEGVLLLNTSLTVEESKPNSHKPIWETFISMLIEAISTAKPNLVWLLMGNEAKSFEKNILNGNIVKTVHPMADRYGAKVKFVGSDCFKKVNYFLKEPINF